MWVSWHYSASLLWSTYSLHMSPQNFFDSSAFGRSSSHLSSSWFNSQQFPSLIQLLLIILKHSVLSKPIYLSWCLLTFDALATVLSFNSLITTPRVFTLILYFLSNVCQCLTLLNSFSFDYSKWLKSFLIRLISYCTSFPTLVSFCLLL